MTRNCLNVMRKYAANPMQFETVKSGTDSGMPNGNPREITTPPDKKYLEFKQAFDEGFGAGNAEGIRRGADMVRTQMNPALEGYKNRYLNWRKYGLRGGGAILGASLGSRGGALGTLLGGVGGWFGGALMDSMMSQYNPFLTKKAPISSGGTVDQNKQQEAV